MANWALHEGTRGYFFVDYDVVQIIARSAYHDIYSNKSFKSIPIEKKGYIAKLIEPPYSTWSVDEAGRKPYKDTLGSGYANDLFNRIVNERLNPGGVKASLENMVKRGISNRMSFRNKTSNSQSVLLKSIQTSVDRGELAIETLTFIRQTSETILNLMPLPAGKILSPIISIGGNFLANQASVGTKRATTGLALDVVTELAMRVVPLKALKGGYTKRQGEAAALVIGTSLNVANTAVTKGSWTELSVKTLIDSAGAAGQVGDIPMAILNSMVKIPVKVNLRNTRPTAKSKTKLNPFFDLTVDFGTIDLINQAVTPIITNPISD